MNNINQSYLEKNKEFLSFRNLSESTIAIYTSYLSQFLTWMEQYLPTRSVMDISYEEIRSFILYLKTIRTLNPRTINVHIAQLKDFFRYTLHRDFDHYQVPYLRIDQSLPHVPSISEVNRILHSIHNLKHKAMITLLYSSGIRVSELCRLRCGDIYASKQCIYISKSKNRSDRFAILSKKALELLSIYIRSCYPDAKKEDWLFPGRTTDAPISQQSIYLVFLHHLEQLGLKDKGFSLHSLRHAFGLHLYEAGTDLMSIKEAMGHKSISSTTLYLSLGIGNGRSVVSPYDF